LSLAEGNRPQVEEVVSSLFDIAYFAVEAQRIFLWIQGIEPRSALPEQILRAVAAVQWEHYFKLRRERRSGTQLQNDLLIFEPLGYEVIVNWIVKQRPMLHPTPHGRFSSKEAKLLRRLQPMPAKPSARYILLL
jgi:hypothetical protein